MAMNLAIFLTSLLLLPPLSLSFSPENTSTNQRILVLLDDRLIKSSHSLYFKSLQNHGYNLDFKLSTDPKISLHRHGQYLYDGLILFSPSVKKFGGTLDFTSVLEFVDSGHNLILVVDRYASDLIRNIATVFRVDLDEDSSAVVIDHIHYAVSDIEGDHTLLAIDGFNRSDVILGTQMIKAPVLFKGIGHVLNPFNSQVLKVLSASSSAYSANPDTELSNRPSLSGSRISLVSVVQARINARVLISGSLDLFSNRLFRSSVQKSGTLTKYPKSGNEQFTFELSKWVLHDRREDDLRRCTILLKSECDDREKQTSLEKQSLCERRKLFRLDEEVQLSQRERYINGRQQELSQLEKTLEESKAKIETELKIMNKDKTDLKLKLDALSTRMEAVCKKEAMLDKKEAELLFTQEKLARREHDEIQKLVAKLQASLEVKKFESEEIEHRRIAMQNEMNTKRRACELKELDLRQSEEFLQEKEMEFDVSLEKNKEERNSAALLSTKKGFFDHLKDAAELATETIILSKGCCATEPCPFDEYVRCKERISRHMEKLAALPYVFYIPYGLLLYIPHVLRHPLPQRE